MMNVAELHVLTRTLRDIMTAAAAADDESPAPGHVIAVVEDLKQHPATTARDIVNRTGIAQSMVSTTLAEMADAGLVTAERDPADGRRRVLSLTPAGRATLGKRGAKTVTAALTEAVADMDGDTAREVERLLDRVNALLRPTVDPHDPGPQRRAR